MTEQLALGLRLPGRDLEREFEAWFASRDGGTIYHEAVERARRLKETGFRHYSIDAIYHSIRFDASVAVGPDVDGYRLNDHHTSRLARAIMRNHPELDGFFETRRLRVAG